MDTAIELSIKLLKEKIELFSKNIKDYESKSYNEYNTRVDFIDVMFSALGWDMHNRENYIENYRAVVREDKIDIDGNKKAPDYSFRIGQEIIFYVEAKKPSINIKNDPNPAFQLRRYAHSKELLFSVLTNFEEIAIYDGRIPPKVNDSAGIARVFYCTYDQLFEKTKIEGYETNFDFLFKTFGYQAIWHGSFRQYAEKNQKGTKTVDKGFLGYLEKWRKNLAEGIALKNESIDEYNLNIAVQKIIDRLIFIRIAEDRKIEYPDYLLKVAKNNKNIYSSLIALFAKADKKYNSGLFISDDSIGLKDLIIEDKILKDIIEEMYYPFPYEFSVLPIEILGKAYEQLLGKSIKYIRKTKFGHKIKIDKKPEIKIRKGSGIYYTPPYIVNYIVKNTVGAKIDRFKPSDIETLTIIDPACGSGSFLIGAYNYLLNYHLKYYIDNELKKSVKNGIIYKIVGNRYKLSAKTKSEILLNNIYGVDIDPQAVEVTKLSLLLKVLEDENLEYSEELYKTEQLDMLPNLSNNIKCGNSLIEKDYYTSNEEDLFNTIIHRKVNSFDWKNEFSNIINTGGFDIVIGNPPWVSLSRKFKNNILSDPELKYLIKKYNGNTYSPNLYEYFIWKGLELTKDNGLFSFIVPDRLGFNQQFKELRKYILDNFSIEKLLYKAEFPEVTVDTLIYIFNNTQNNNKIEVGKFGLPLQTVDKNTYLKDSNHTFFYEDSIEISDIVKKIDGLDSKKLGKCFDTNVGFITSAKLITEEKNNSAQIEILKGNCISKYQVFNKLFFEFNKNNIGGGTNDKNKLGATPKIVIRKTGYPIYAAYDESGMFPEQSLYFLFNNKTEASYYFYLGILNSNVFRFYYLHKLVTNKNSTPQLKKFDLDSFPIPTIADVHNDKIHSDIKNAVKKIIELLKTDNNFNKKQILDIDDYINKQVYDLYSLNKEDIAVIENNLQIN